MYTRCLSYGKTSSCIFTPSVVTVYKYRIIYMLLFATISSNIPEEIETVLQHSLCSIKHVCVILVEMQKLWPTNSDNVMGHYKGTILKTISMQSRLTT